MSKTEKNFTKFIEIKTVEKVQIPIKLEKLVKTNWTDVKGPTELGPTELVRTKWIDIRNSMIIQNLFDDTSTYVEEFQVSKHKPETESVAEPIFAPSIRSTKTENSVFQPDFMQRSMYPISGQNDFFRRN